MKFFNGRANIPLAKHVADELGMQLGRVDTHVFPDGERRIRIAEPVVDEQVFVLQTANTPVDSNYMELFFLIDALKRSGAEFVTTIIPYFGYQRQDHVFQDGEAVSLEVIINILEHIGANRVISFDMHSVKIPSLFTIPVTHVSALPLFAAQVIHNGWDRKDTVLVSPDMGGVARIKKLSELLNNMDIASLEKNRNLVSGELSGDAIHGVVTGKKRALLIDDMIATGGTMFLAAERLLQRGITDVYAFATHAVFTEEAAEKMEKSKIKSFFVTDTVSIPKEKQFTKLQILSIAREIANTIKDQ